MQNIFRIIKRKRNLRRLSAVWLFLVVIELFCPVICDEPTFAATLNPSQTTLVSTIDQSDKTSQTSFSDYDSKTSGEEGTLCNDECLCHAMAVLSQSIVNIKESITRSERIAFSYGKPVFNSLPPPFQPPKNS